MEPIAIAFAVGLGAMPSIQSMTLNECDRKAEQDKQTLCVMVEDPCAGEECNEPIAKKKPSYKRVYYRKNGRLLYRTVRR